MNNAARKTITLLEATAIMEALMNPNHYQHHAAVRRAEELMEERRKEAIIEGQRMMQAQIDQMDEDELAAFHRNND